MNLFSVILKGGVLMYAIILASLAGGFIIVKQILKMRKIEEISSVFISKIKSLLVKGDISAALEHCDSVNNPAASIFKSALSRIHLSDDAIEKAMENEAKEQVFYLEKDLGFLETLASITPLLGFLGTVTGMIQAFYQIQQLGGNVDATVLAGGIWEALVTTAAGLTVGIPLLLFYNYFIRQIEEIVFEMRKRSSEMLEHISSYKGGNYGNFDQ